MKKDIDPSKRKCQKLSLDLAVKVKVVRKAFQEML